MNIFRLKRIHGAGLILKSFEDNKIEEIFDSNEDVTSLGIDSVLPLFYLQLLAIIAGLLVFFLENWIARRKLKRKTSLNYSQ